MLSYGFEKSAKIMLDLAAVSGDIYKVEENYARSCEICTSRGYCQQCSCCPIKQKHDDIVDKLIELHADDEDYATDIIAY